VRFAGSGLPLGAEKQENENRIECKVGERSLFTGREGSLQCGPVGLRRGQISDDGVGLRLRQSGQHLAERRRRKEVAGQAEVEFARDLGYWIDGAFQDYLALFYSQMEALLFSTLQGR
jgi:hypothetical protein